MTDFTDTIAHIMKDRAHAEQLHHELGLALYRDSQSYPSRHPRGSYWATDIGWNILDSVSPDQISPDVRAWLCGLIGGAIARVAKEGKPQ